MWKFMALALILAKKACVFDLLRQHDLLSGVCVWSLSFLWASLASILPSNGELSVCANLCLLELSLGCGSQGIYDGVAGFWWWLDGHLEAASHCHCLGGEGLNVSGKQGGKKKNLEWKINVGTNGGQNYQEKSTTLGPKSRSDDHKTNCSLAFQSCLHFDLIPILSKK